MNETVNQNNQLQKVGSDETYLSSDHNLGLPVFAGLTLRLVSRFISAFNNRQVELTKGDGGIKKGSTSKTGQKNRCLPSFRLPLNRREAPFIII